MEKYLVLHRLSYEKTLFSFCLSHTIVPKYLEPSEEDEVQAILYEGVTAKEIHQNPADSAEGFLPPLSPGSGQPPRGEFYKNDSA